MRNKMYRLLYIVFLFAALGASAQDMPERSEVRRGNRQYNKGNYEKSIERYERALEAAPESFEARYNLGNALYKAERFDKAEQTGGQYFRATDKAKLKAIYDQINQLEKSKVEVTEHVTYHEQFLLWALAGLGLLVLEFLFSNLVLKRIP